MTLDVRLNVRRSALGTRLPLPLAALVGVLAYGYPFLLPATAAAGEAGAHAADAPLVFAALALLAMVALVGEVQAGPGRSPAKLVALLGVLVAINSALRLLPGIGGASGVFVLIVLMGYVYRATYGFLMGTLTLLVSALITGGVGPWLPYQMLGAGWMGQTAGWLPDLARRPRLERAALAAFGALWGLGYGLILNLWFWPFLGTGTDADAAILWTPGIDAGEALRRYALFYLLTSLAYDLPRAVATAALIVALGRPLLAVLRRFRRRFAWTPVTPVLSAQCSVLSNEDRGRSEASGVTEH